MSPTLRSDIYTAIDQAKTWIAGRKGGSHPGDGVSYGAILATIRKHMDAKFGMDSLGRAEEETAVVVAGVTNMVLLMSQWEAMASGMAMKTWVDALVVAHSRADAPFKDAIARGIINGVNNADVSLMTADFTAKIQIISSLKSLSSRVYASESEETRRAAEATLSSKFI